MGGRVQERIIRVYAAPCHAMSWRRLQSKGQRNLYLYLWQIMKHPPKDIPYFILR